LPAVGFGSETLTSIGTPSKEGIRVAMLPWQYRVPSDCVAHGIFPKALTAAWAVAGAPSAVTARAARRRRRIMGAA
jgi:hypothetical protein